MDLEFDKYIIRIDKILRMIGMSINRDDIDRTTVERFKYHWTCFIHLVVFHLSIIGQLIWLVLGIINGESLLKITYLIPCVTMCMLGGIKIVSFIHYVQHVHDAILRLKMLECLIEPGENYNEDLKKTWFKFLNKVYSLMFLLTTTGLLTFAIGPFIIIASFYFTTGEVKLVLPFIMWYPIDEFKMHNWPFVYFQQLWSACVAVLSVNGPDCFFFTCCTYIHLHFVYLQQDMEQIVKKDSWKVRKYDRLNSFKEEFVQLVNRHRELIRCVELLNAVYCKSTLFNVVTSSVIICAAGFNLMAIQDLALMAPFCSFLIFGMLQVFFYCYYGDYVLRSSTELGDAIYNSRWYEACATERKYLLTVLVRAQKPCKFTAYRFADVNLRAFTRILSTSWSYFALLNQMYQN